MLFRHFTCTSKSNVNCPLQRRCAGMDGNFFRSIEARGTDILLDVKFVFLRGISIQEEAPMCTGRVWSEEDERTLLGWAKELVCNFVCLAQYPHNEAIDAGDKPNGTFGLGIRTKRSFRRTILGNEDVVDPCWTAIEGDESGTPMHRVVK